MYVTLLFYGYIVVGIEIYIIIWSSSVYQFDQVLWTITSENSKMSILLIDMDQQATTEKQHDVNLPRRLSLRQPTLPPVTIMTL